MTPAVYIMANRKRGTLHTGVTVDRPKRVWEHRESVISGFSARYSCKTLVWFEIHANMTEAILREKRLKGGSRQKKIDLIEADNPDWRDLYPDLFAA